LHVFVAALSISGVEAPGEGDGGGDVTQPVAKTNRARRILIGILLRYGASGPRAVSVGWFDRDGEGRAPRLTRARHRDAAAAPGPTTTPSATSSPAARSKKGDVVSGAQWPALCAEVGKLRVSVLDGDVLPLATEFATAELRAVRRWRKVVTPMGT
jgi:hypothetical protein